MALLEFFGCAFIAFGPALAMFAFTISKDPIRIIILIASAFFWLLSLLLSSLLWLVASSLDGPLVVGLVFSVVFQELFRFFIYILLRKADAGLKKLTDSETQIVTNKNILAYGLGFGVISGLFSLVNVLADAVGPGTVGLQGDSNLFFLTSAITTLCFVLLHTTWGVLFFHALDKKNYWALVWVVSSHMAASCLTLLNAQQLYAASIIPIIIILLLSTALALRAAGATVYSFKQGLKRNPPLTVAVSAE